jgi:HPt (histidine-containing phosphotransfer) domain-containing protein
MIDWSHIKTLREEVGPEDFDDVVEIFIEEVTETIDRMRDEPQIGTLGEDLHALKGSALNLGFTQFAELCQIGETLAADSRSEEIDLPPIFACYNASKAAFLAGLKDGEAA